jgi:hypothetical protein
MARHGALFYLLLHALPAYACARFTCALPHTPAAPLLLPATFACRACCFNFTHSRYPRLQLPGAALAAAFAAAALPRHLVWRSFAAVGYRTSDEHRGRLGIGWTSGDGVINM